MTKLISLPIYAEVNQSISKMLSNLFLTSITMRSLLVEMLLKCKNKKANCNL